MNPTKLDKSDNTMDLFAERDHRLDIYHSCISHPDINDIYQHVPFYNKIFY